MDATSEHVVRLPAELTIYGASALRGQLAEAIADAATGGQALVLDLANVCEIDSAGLQLLMAARKDADARALTLELRAHTATVSEALALFGLDGQARGGHHGS